MAAIHAMLAGKEMSSSNSVPNMPKWMKLLYFNWFTTKDCMKVIMNAECYLAALDDWKPIGWEEAAEAQQQILNILRTYVNTKQT